MVMWYRGAAFSKGSLKGCMLAASRDDRWTYDTDVTKFSKHCLVSPHVVNYPQIVLGNLILTPTLNC